MLINLDETRQILRGYSTLEATEKGWYPCRFEAGNAWAGREGFMQGCPAGVRLCFKTDATTLRLNLILGECIFEFGRGDVDVFADSQRIFTAKPEGPWTIRQIFKIEVPLPEGQPVITVYLPTYRSTVIQRMELVGGSFVQPVTGLSGRILFLGDSITQGYGATPGMCYAAQLARALDCDFLNLGIGGACMPERLPETLELGGFSHVVLAFGTNDANATRSAGDVTRCLHRLLDRVCGGGRAVMVSSPIAMPEGRRRGREEAWREVSGAIRLVAGGHPGGCYVDGGRILPWDDSFFVDGIHPNAEGMTRLAQAFLDALAHGRSE